MTSTLRRVQRLDVSGPPASYVVGSFPDGRPRAHAPVAVHYSVVIARRLRDALEGENLSALCARAGMDRSTVQRLVAGQTWPELVTLAKLETVLDVRLWLSDQERRQLPG